MVKFKESQAWLVFLGIFFIACVPAMSDEITKSETEKSVKVTLNGLQITFDKNTGSILEMFYPSVGKFLETSTQNASILDMAYPVEEFEPLRLASRFSRNACIEKGPDCVTIKWNKLGMSRKVEHGKGYRMGFDEKADKYTWLSLEKSPFDIPGKVSASVIFKAAPDGKSIIMTCEIDNQSENTVRQVLFPDFYGLIPFAGEDKTCLRSGQLDIKPFIQLQAPKRRSPFWVNDPALAGVEYVTGGSYYNSKMLTQWLDFGSLGGGFSLYRRGWGWEPKTDKGNVRLKRSELTGKLRMSWTRKVTIKPKEKWQSVEFWLTPHTGGWAKGIEPYRQWVRQNMKKRKYPVPDHIRKGLGLRTIWMSTFAYPADPNEEGFYTFKFKDLPRLAKESKEHGLDEMVIWAWNMFFQLPLPPPFPQLGSEQELAEAIAECKELGVNVSLFISVCSLAQPSASRYGVKVPAKGGWTYHPELIPPFKPDYAKKMRTTMEALHKSNNEPWQADVLSSCRDLINTKSASICWDQFIPSLNNPTCYLAGKIRDMAKEKDPESTFSGESVTYIEVEALYLDYLWNWGSYTSGGDLLPFTSTFSAPRVAPLVNTSPEDVKCCFMNNLYMNIMPRKPESINGSATIEEHPQLSKALKQCNKLRKKFLNYFTDGTPIGKCLLSEECSGSYVSSYVLPDRMLMILMNKSNRAAALKFKTDLYAWLKSESGKYKVGIYNDSGKLLESKQIDSGKWGAATKNLQPYEMVLFEFQPGSEGLKFGE
jgi:hypothetical protein